MDEKIENNKESNKKQPTAHYRLQLLPYEFLQGCTQHLMQKFNEFSGRYILDDTYLQLREKIENLRKNYEVQVSQKPKTIFSSFWGNNTPGHVRIEQISLIEFICQDLPKQCRDPQQEAASRTILLGALIYRYLRLLLEYKNDKNSARKNCALFAVLEKILLIDDKNKLDDLTIETTCTALCHFLKNSQEEPIFIKEKLSLLSPKLNKTNYSYVNQDKEFFQKLEEMILKAKKNNQCIYQQVYYIEFISSIANVLKDMDEEVNLFLANMKKQCKGQENIKISDFIEYFTTEKVKPCTKLLLQNSMGILSEKISIFKKFEFFEKKIKGIIKVKNQCALLGGFVVVLHQCDQDQSMKVLKNSIYHLLKSHENYALGNEIKDFAVRALNDFIQYPNIEELLNLKPFKQLSVLKKELLTLQEMLEPQEILTTNRMN